MGAFHFQLPPNTTAETNDLKQAYLVGFDRTPFAGSVQIEQGTLTLRRQESESGRLLIPYRTQRHGRLVLSTATLRESNTPYNLLLELARGTLNDLLNQHAEWEMLGLKTRDPFPDHIKSARQCFARATTASHSSDVEPHARLSIENAIEAGRLLVQTYSEQLIQHRREIGSLNGSSLILNLPGLLDSNSLPSQLSRAFRGARVHCSWGNVAPEPGVFNWEIMDAQLRWCVTQKLSPSFGPLIDLRPHALPDWLWLWQGDFNALVEQASEWVQAAISRYRGKTSSWQLIHRVGSGNVLGLSETDQLRLSARLLQLARQLDSTSNFVVGFDRPWGDTFPTGQAPVNPLHLADALAQANLGLSGITLEIAPGFQSPGSPLRELLEFSRLLDLYSMIGLPLHLSLAIPSSAGKAPARPGLSAVDSAAWPDPVDETSQRDWAGDWLKLAIAKPYVQSVTWLETSDAHPDLFPHSGLLRSDGSSKPILTWLENFQRSLTVDN